MNGTGNSGSGENNSVVFIGIYRLSDDIPAGEIDFKVRTQRIQAQSGMENQDFVI